MRFCQSLMYSPPGDWVELTRVAEAAGFDQVSLSDHVFHPDKLDSSYPYTDDGRPMFPPEARAMSTRPIRFVHRGRIVEVEGAPVTRSVLDWFHPRLHTDRGDQLG